MKLSELCKEINLPQDVTERVLDEEKQMKAQNKNTVPTDLTSQLLRVCETHTKYLNKGIDEKIFTDTMKCFTRFIKECKDRTGKAEFDRGWWTHRQINMVLFRIGELEYELTQSQGRNEVSVHIPSDAEFTPEKVDESLKQAEEFMAKFYPDYKDVEYFCESWLLSPRLGEIVKETSNIAKFQKRFRILEDLPDDKEYMEWLFGAKADTPVQELPENTSLQRKARELLANGGNLGAAVGIMEKMR